MKMRSVRFSQSSRSEVEIESESEDRTSVLPFLQDALYSLGLCVTQARSRVEGGSLFERIEVAEADGQPLSETRYYQVQAAVLSRFMTAA